MSGLPFKKLRVILAFIFELQSLSFWTDASSQIPNSTRTEPSLQIPSHLGTVEKADQGNKSKVVYLIRDLHVHEEAQRKEISILQWLQRKTGLNSVLIEGAEGFLSTALLRTLSFDPAFQKSLMDKFLASGDLTAAEYLAVMEPHLWNVRGIEKSSLYWANVEAFQKTRRMDEITLRKIFKKAEKKAQRAFQKNAPLRLIHFYRIQKRLNENKIELKQYCKVLLEIATSVGLKKSHFPQLHATERLDQLEPILKDGALEKEFQERLEAKIKNKPPFEAKKWIQIFLAHRIGKISHAEYLNQIQPLFNPDEESDFASYFEALRLQEKLELTKFQSELDQLGKEIETNLLWSSGLYRLKTISEKLSILRKVCFLQLSPQEYHQIQNWNFNKVLREISQWKDQKLLASPDRNILRTRLRNALKFYITAKTRDEVLSENIFQFIQEKKLNEAAIVIGGFHSDAIAKKLSQKGMTVMVITPRLKTINDESKYLKIMSGKGTPLDTLLGNKVLDAEIKTQLRPPAIPLRIAQELMPPLRLAQAHTLLRRALEEKALFLSFLNFLYFEAKGPSFLREIERFKNELKKSYIKNLEEELEENEIPQADRTELIENAILHLERFFASLNVQNIDKKGSSLKIQASFGGEPFEIDSLQNPPPETPALLRDAIEAAELRDGVQWILKPLGFKDPHWLEVREILDQEKSPEDLPKDLDQRIWAQASVSVEDLKRNNPALFTKYPNQKIKETTPVVSLEEKDGKKIYHILAGENTILHQSRYGKIYHVNAWVGRTPKDIDSIINEYKTWDKNALSFSSFDNTLKSKMEKLFDLLMENQTLAESDESLYEIFRKTIFSNIPSDVQDRIIDGFKKEPWISDWTALEKTTKEYGATTSRTALREAQLFLKEDGRIHWGNLRNLVYSQSYVVRIIVWELMKPPMLKPLALHYLQSSDDFKREEAVRILCSFGIDKDVLFKVLKEENHFRVIDAASDFLSKLGNNILPEIESLWNPKDLRLIERLSTTLIKINTPKSFEMFCRLYFELPNDAKPALFKFFGWRRLEDSFITSLLKVYREDFISHQKEDFLNVLNEIESDNVLGPLLYFANSQEAPIREKARALLAEKPQLMALLRKTSIDDWSSTVQFLKEKNGLNTLGSALHSLSQFSKEDLDQLLEQFTQEPLKTLLDHALSEQRDIAFTAATLLDKLNIQREKSFKHFLPNTELQTLTNLIPNLSLSYTDLLEIKFLIKQRGEKAFLSSIEQLKNLKKRLNPEAFEALIKNVGLITLLRIDGFQEYVELKISPQMTLEVHPGVVETLRDTLGAQVSKRTIVFNSLRLVEGKKEDIADTKERVLIFRQFNEANFQVIGYFEKGDWTKKRFKTSKNRSFQTFLEMLRFYEMLSPQDPEIPKMRQKANQLSEKIDADIKEGKYDKSAIMDIGPYQNLDEISTLHGLLRYLHGRGGEQLFDVVKVQLKKSDKVSAVSTYMIDLGGNVLDQVQHPILLVSDYDPKKGLPDTLKYFMRNMIHAINPLHSPENQKALKKLVDDQEIFEDFHLNFSSPHVQAIIDEHEIIAYFAMGMHTSELIANLTHPNEGGLIQFRWNEGEWKRDLPGAWRERLYLIKKMLEHLGVQANINDWQLRARFDKETGARSIGDILKVAGTILRTHASFRYLDLPLGLTGLKDKALNDYLDALSQFLNRMGKVEFYKAALGISMTESVEVLERHEEELRAVLNTLLIDLGLEIIPEAESRPFGQVAINRYFNKKIEDGLHNKTLFINSEGRVEKDPTLKAIRQVPQMASRFSDEEELKNLFRMGALIRTLAQDLKFTSIGTINGYLVQRAHLEILGRVLTLLILRNHQGEILTGLAASGPELYSRVSKNKTVSNMIRSPEFLLKLLRRNGFPVSETSHKLSAEEEEKAFEDFQRIKANPLPVQGKLLPGYATPGVGISTGLAVGKVRLDKKDLNPEELGNHIWIVPFALPDHASKIRKSTATVMTGGARLTHAGMLIREARRPGIIVDGRWVYEEGKPVEVRIPYETFDRVSEEVGEFHITRRQNIERRVAVLQDEDIVLVNGDGEIYSFPPHLQEKARQILAWTNKIKTGKEVFSIYLLAHLLTVTDSQDLTQLAVFDLFLNSTELSPYEKKEFLRIFTLNLPADRRLTIRKYLNDYLAAKRRTVTNTLHDIKVRIPEVRQPIELEFLLSRAMNTVEDFQNIQMMIGQSARVYRSSLSEIVDLAKKRVDELKQEIAGLSGAGPEWLLNIKLVERARKLGAIAETMYANAKSWFKEWLNHQRERLKGQMVYSIGPGVQKALAFMVDRIGAKAAKLAEVSNLVPVPKGFVIDVDAYNQFLKENNLVSEIHSIISSELSSAEKSKQIQELIYKAPIPKEMEEKFLQEFRDLEADSVAVRSSSTAEDLDTASFAGQMETTLNVQGEEAFLAAVKRSWASLWTQRAIEYRRDYDIPLEVGQAVFVQTMIDSQVSGVISTMNVLTNDWSEMVVNSGWGLGSGPIEGKTNSDQFILDMKTGRLKEELIAKKTAQYTKESGNNPVPVSPNRVFAKTLTPDQLSTLHQYSKILEDYYGFPLDIEFAIDRNETIHIVQVRPITTVDVRKDINLVDLSSLHRKVLDNFVDNLWGEFRSLVENGTNGLDSLRTLQNLFRRQLYANPNYKGYMYILVNVLQRWLKEYGMQKDVDALAPEIYVIADELKQKPYETWSLEQFQTTFPNEFKRLETYLKPFIDQKFEGAEKLSEPVRMQSHENPHASVNRYAEISMENMEEALFVNNALSILESGKSLILEGEYEWLRDHFYLLIEQLYFEGKQEWIDRILASPASLKEGPKILGRLYTEEPLIQLSEILPLAFHNGSLVRLASLKDAPAITKLNNEMANKLGEPERSLEYFQQLLRDNPLTLMGVNKTGKIEGALFLGLIRSKGLEGLPENYQSMTRAHQDSEDVNTMVDFWILRMPELIPISKYLASKWGLEQLIAYSRPSRGGILLYELAKADQPDLDFNELMNTLVRKIDVKDRLVTYFDRINAGKLLGIQVDYHTDEGLDHFMSLYLAKHLMLASRDSVEEAISNRRPFLKWMTTHQDELAGEFPWFSFDKVWNYLHSDELNFDPETNVFEFVRRMKPVVQKFLKDTGRWTLESVLWKLHIKAEVEAIFPGSRSDGTYQDLWSNVIMLYPIRPNYISAPPIKAESLKIPAGQTVLERAA